MSIFDKKPVISLVRPIRYCLCYLHFTGKLNGYYVFSP